ncbi:MAG: hypothetical protein H7Y86_19195 [Rhizobacter sp.]|nr:hypothetical protein [Ferruginibacter sp.]
MLNETTLLKDTFINLVNSYSQNSQLTDNLWNEIEKSYSGKKRHYHNLLHLSSLLTQLTEIKTVIRNWDALLFSLYYHDIIYNTLKNDNEEKSAEIAQQRMIQLRVPAGITALCKAQIIATKLHGISGNNDTDLFTDADLSVLGQPWEIYTAYYKNIRKEYALYPALIYNPGRKKVLTHFLKMNPIFKTPFFYSRFEKQARENLQKELELLTNNQ